MNKIHIIGIGYRPLNKRAREILLEGDTILASSRLHEVFQKYEDYSLVKEKVMLINKVDHTMTFIRDNAGKRAIVLLASGDPLFFGIGGTIIKEFGADCVEILPDLSSIQLAFSSIRESWDDAFLMSLHGGPDPERRRRLKYELSDLPALLAKYDKIAILTDRENSPTRIADFLNSGLLAEYTSLLMYVCEKLGYREEKITSGTPAEIAGMTFTDPNVVIIANSQELTDKTEMPEEGFGLNESDIVHSRGLITKDEVRAVSLHKLRLPQRGIFWDIGAGSGSVSIEAARLSPGLKVHAIERNEEQISNIRENIVRFGLSRIEVISGEAPEILRNLPSPDRVFIGGSRGRLAEIICCVMEKMPRGIIVLNAISLDTLNDAMLLLDKNGVDPEVSHVSVSRSKIVNGQRHMSALNPIFIVKGERK